MYILGQLVGLVALLLLLQTSAVVAIAILDPIADIQDSVESCSLLALEFHGFAMDTSEVLVEKRIISNMTENIANMEYS